MSEQLTLTDVLHVARSRYRQIAIGVLAFLGVSLFAAFYMSPVYRVETLLVPAAKDSALGGLSPMLGGLGGLASLAGLNLPSDAQTDEALALLKSREFTQAFISDNDLLPVLFRKKWDAKAQRWRASEKDVPTLWDGYKYFNRKVRRAYHDKATSHVTLQIEWNDPQVAARWANELAVRVNDAMRKRAIEEAERSIELLNAELAKTQVVSLQQAISELIQRQIERRTIAEVREEFAFRILDRAAAPDADDFVRPKRLLYIAVGLFMGFMLSLSFVVLMERQRAYAVNRGAA